MLSSIILTEDSTRKFFCLNKFVYSLVSKYRMSQKFVPLKVCISVRLDLVSKSFKQKLCLSTEFTIFILVKPSFDSNIRFVYFRAEGARARVYFPATYFLYFIALIDRNPSLFYVNITKDKPP